VVSNPYDTVLYKLNIYEIHQGKIGRNIIQKEIIIKVKKGAGLLSVNLLPYKLMVYDDFVVGLELIEPLEENNIMFSGSLLGNKAYSREGVGQDWLPMSILSIGYYVEVSQ